MSSATARRAIELGCAETEREAKGEGVGVVFYGGEPLLKRELIVETIRYCRQVQARTGIPFHFKMTTNGLLLDEAFL